MKIAKRLLAFTICLTMLLSCALIQAEETNAEITVYGSHTLGLINALGIADYTEENLTEPITRGEFYALLAKANGYPGIEDEQTLFSDLKPGDDYESFVKTLYKIGLITTTKDGRTKAGEPISATEAVALTVKSLGYSPRAEAMGGYPGGYLQVAAVTDVSDDIDLSVNEIPKGLALEIIYNALEADIMIEVPSVGSSSKEYKVERGTNLLNTVHGLEVIEGIVDGVDISRVSGKNDVLPFHMEIAGQQLNCEDVAEPFGYLGYNVKVYHKFVRTYGDKIIYIEITDSNEEYIFDVEDINGISDSKMEAYEEKSDKVKSYRLKKAIPVVYNGVATNMPFTYEMINGKNGTVRLLDNDNNKVADIAFVEVYENWIVSYSNKSEKLIYDKYDNNKKLVLDNEIDEPYVIIYDEAGVEIQPAKLETGDVVSVYFSADDAYQKYIRVYVSKKVASGEVEEICDKNEITVDGTVYEFTDSCLKHNANIISVGALLKLSLDVYGYVAEVEAVSSPDMIYGFLVAADVESGGLGGKAKFMFYTGEEELLTAYAAKNVYIDGCRYSNTNKNMFETLRAAAKHMFPASDEDVRSSVVRYALNSQGEVTAVDTIMYDAMTSAIRESNHTAKNTLFAVKTQENDMYRKVSNHIVIGSNIPVSNNTMVISYPDAASDKATVFNTDEYDYLKITSIISHGDRVNGWAFYTRENQIVSDFIAVPKVDKTSENIPSSAKFVVVDKLGKMMDKKSGTEIDCITFKTADGDTKVPVKSGFTFALNGVENTIDKLINGDVVRYKTDANGYLKSLVIYYRATTNQIVNTTGLNGSVTNDFSWIDGYVYKSYPEGFYLYPLSINENGVIQTGKKVLEDVTVDDCIFVYHSAYNNNGHKIDLTEKMDSHVITGLSVANVRSFVETGYDCSFVLVQRYSGAPYVVIEVEGLKESATEDSDGTLE